MSNLFVGQFEHWSKDGYYYLLQEVVTVEGPAKCQKDYPKQLI